MHSMVTAAVRPILRLLAEVVVSSAMIFQAHGAVIPAFFCTVTFDVWVFTSRVRTRRARVLLVEIAPPSQVLISPGLIPKPTFPSACSIFPGSSVVIPVLYGGDSRTFPPAVPTCSNPFHRSVKHCHSPGRRPSHATFDTPMSTPMVIKGFA